MRISQKSKHCYNATPSAYHLYVKTKILVDLHICISVPLNATTGSNGNSGRHYSQIDDRWLIRCCFKAKNPAKY